MGFIRIEVAGEKKPGQIVFLLDRLLLIKAAAYPTDKAARRNI